MREAFVLPIVAVALACDAPARGEPASATKPGAATQATTQVSSAEWRAFGGDAGGSQYSPLEQINRHHVGQLQVAWDIRTGDWGHMGEGSPEAAGPCARCHTGDYKFEATPIVAGGRLFVGTPFNRALALDPATGRQLWSFQPDPPLALDIDRNEGFISRGVSYWEDAEAADGATCAARVFLPTVDARLIALDAASGEPCEEFGEGGTVRIDQGVGDVVVGMYGITSPPAIVGDAVIVGSAIGDRHVVNLEHGNVRAYDARSGALLWDWDPVPRRPGDPGWATWRPEAARAVGGGNAWAPLSADPERDMVFVPTGAVSPDFYGGERPGANLFANSVVALRASTGEMLWHFQTVHHDIWDFDLASQPTLTSIERDGQDVPVVVVATKAGLVFVLDRVTGEPVFPVEERPVPASDVLGEEAWPTQPFPVAPPPIHPHQFTDDEVWGITEEERAACRTAIEPLRNEGVFTPPSTSGTLMFPGFAGGVNWGGIAVDPSRRVMITNVLRLPMWVRLTPRSEQDRAARPMGTAYSMSRAPLVSPSGIPCNRPPWGTLVSVDLQAGEVLWEVPLGILSDELPMPQAAEWGSLNLGGPLLTAGGLVFIGATMDDAIRAYDIETGTELWKADLPAGGNANPVTYEVDGTQYVVIVAGGHSLLGSTLGDHVVAFRLP